MSARSKLIAEWHDSDLESRPPSNHQFRNGQAVDASFARPCWSEPPSPTWRGESAQGIEAGWPRRRVTRFTRARCRAVGVAGRAQTLTKG
jgi:hypothetical protein